MNGDTYQRSQRKKIILINKKEIEDDKGKINNNDNN